MREAIEQFEATGSPVIIDGEQAKPASRRTQSRGHDHLAPDGVRIPFADEHVRQLARLTAGPFRYRTYATMYLARAKRCASVPVKQPVITALSLRRHRRLPARAVPAHLVAEAQADVRAALEGGADSVRVDFTEGRLW